MSGAMPGLLVLVVGPSGSGKDTLLSGAAQALAGDARFRFVRRVVTRPAQEEDHDVADEPGFHARRAAGGFALNWEAHGLHYGVPADIVQDLEAGRTVVANVSRSILVSAAERFPVAVIEITASERVRAARLRDRARETPADIAARLARAAPPPEGLSVFTILNDSSVAHGVATLTDFLYRIAENVQALPHPSEAPAPE